MRLIDADELLAEVVKTQALEPSKAVAKIIMLITEAEKVDAVEVVRCRDCKYGEYAGLGKFMCDLHEFLGKGGFYCASGERKDNV